MSDMLSPAKRPRTEISSACTECQRRKGKCTGGRPCTFCTKTKRKCVDQQLVERIPLTRKNMDDLQSRCERLEAILCATNPSLDIKELLNDNNPPFTMPTLQNIVQPGSDAHSVASTGITTPDDNPGTPDSLDGVDLTAKAHSFEWREVPASADEQDKLADGMASLNLDSRDVGYLGRSSAASLLRHVHRLLKAHPGQNAFTDVLQQNLRSSPSSSPGPPPQQGTSLPPPGCTEDELVDAYFEFFHACYPLVHEGVFRAGLARVRAGEVTPTTHWQALYLMIKVLGAVMSSRDYRTRLADSVVYDEMAKLFNVDFFSYGTLEGVQALALMGSYLQKRDNPNTGYNVMGMAVRMALGLGLHREFADPVNTNTLGMEIRRRIWWTLYILDVGAGVTFGRPTIPSDKVTTKIPLNVFDDTLTDKKMPLPPPRNGVTKYSAIVAHAHLVLIMNKILLSCFVNPRTIIPAQLVNTFDGEIARWQATLPPYFSLDNHNVPSWFVAPRAIVLWKCYNLRMLMYKCFLDAIPHAPRTFDRDKIPAAAGRNGFQQRPRRPGHSHAPGYVQSQPQSPRCSFNFNTTSDPQPHTNSHTRSRSRAETFVAEDPEVRKCLAFAIQTITSAQGFFSASTALTFLWSWYVTYFVFQAALVLVTAVLQAPKDASVAEWVSRIADATAVLRNVEPATALAGRCAAVLDICVKGFGFDLGYTSAVLPRSENDNGGGEDGSNGDEEDEQGRPAQELEQEVQGEGGEMYENRNGDRDGEMPLLPPEELASMAGMGGIGPGFASVWGFSPELGSSGMGVGAGVGMGMGVDPWGIGLQSTAETPDDDMLWGLGAGASPGFSYMFDEMRGP